MSSLIEFVALVTVLVALPGPAVLLTLKHRMTRGRADALATAAGVLTADLLWIAALCAGLTALLIKHPAAFEIVRYAGAAFLIYVGLRLALARGDSGVAAKGLRVPSAEPGAMPMDKTHISVGAWSAYRDGVICDLSNPKTMIVFTSVIPQFMNAGSGPTEALTLGLLFAFIGLLSLFSYIALFGASSQALQNRVATSITLRVSGLVLVAFGANLIVERPTIA